jgi:hypothetical protein
MNQENAKQNRKRRSLGCAVWALIMAAVSIPAVLFLTTIAHKWERGLAPYIPKHFRTEEIFLLLIVLAIIMLIAAVVGWSTSRPLHRKKVMIVSLVMLSGLFFFAVYRFNGLCKIGEGIGEYPGPKCESLLRTPMTTTATIVIGLLLGLIGGYGYWKAGRE